MTFNKELYNKAMESMKDFDFNSLFVETDAVKSFRKFKVVGADETLNRNERLVVIDGIDTTNFEKNPIVFINHDSYDVEKIVGRVTRITKEKVDGKQAIVFEGEFAPTELGNKIADLWETGFVKTVSMGYNVNERDQNDPRILTKTDLYELSIVAIPANVNAMRLDSATLQLIKDNGIEVIEESEEIKEDKFVSIESKLDMILDMLKVSKDNAPEVKTEEIKEEKQEENKEDTFDFNMFADAMKNIEFKI